MLAGIDAVRGVAAIEPNLDLADQFPLVENSTQVVVVQPPQPELLQPSFPRGTQLLQFVLHFQGPPADDRTRLGQRVQPCQLSLRDPDPRQCLQQRKLGGLECLVHHPQRE